MDERKVTRQFEQICSKLGGKLINSGKFNVCYGDNQKEIFGTIKEGDHFKIRAAAVPVDTATVELRANNIKLNEDYYILHIHTESGYLGFNKVTKKPASISDKTSDVSALLRAPM